MPSSSLLGFTLMVTGLSAAFAIPASSIRTIVKPRDTDCPGTNGDQVYIADLGFYSDADCTESTSSICIYTYEGTANGNPGDYGCNPGLLPDNTPFYAKVEDSPFDEMQIVFTRDQSCPPNGPGAVFATLIDNASCVLMNLGGDAPGISIFPHGGSGIARVAANKNPSGNNVDATFVSEKEARSIVKRAPKCDGFNIESSSPSYSETVQISNILDCTNGAEGGCQITVGSEYTKSVSTSYSVSAGGGIEGIFSVEATFGQEYTESSTTSVQEGFTIPAGQKGYLSAYSAATLFKGKFTGCDEGEAEQPGQALVIKKEGFTYGIVITGT